MNSKNFGKNLKEVLAALDMCQLRLAINTGLTPAAISQIVNSKRKPSIETVCKILKAIPVTFERLVR